MKILAFDTCNGFCSVALEINYKIVAFLEEKERSQQSARLFTMIELVLREHDIWYQDLDYIATNIGPGSFTGVRIGIAAAKGLKLVHQLPIIGLSGLYCLANSIYDHQHNILSVMDARRGQVYAQLFDVNKKPITKELLLNYESLSDLVYEDNTCIIGDGAVYIKEFIKNKFLLAPNIIINAKMVMEGANNMLLINKDYDFCEPLYIREADAKVTNK